MPVTVTTQEILDAIHRAETESPDEAGFTTMELSEGLGLSSFPTRQRIHRMIREGVLEAVKLRRKYIDGRIADTPGYRLVKGKA